MVIMFAWNLKHWKWIWFGKYKNEKFIKFSDDIIVIDIFDYEWFALNWIFMWPSPIPPEEILQNWH